MPASAASLTPVIVGGLLAMGGGVISGGIALLVQWWQRSADKAKRRTEKFEKMVSAVYEFDHWLEKRERKLAFGIDEKLEPSPFAKVEAIAAVHFPRFLKQVSELQLEARQYLLWMSKAGAKRLEGKIAEVNDGLPEVYSQYIDKRDKLLDEMKDFASNNFR